MVEMRHMGHCQLSLETMFTPSELGCWNAMQAGHIPMLFFLRPPFLLELAILMQLQQTANLS